MRKTNAEIHRLYRQRRDTDPHRREEYLQTEQARYTMLKRLTKRQQMSNQSDKKRRSHESYGGDTTNQVEKENKRLGQF